MSPATLISTQICLLRMVIALGLVLGMVLPFRAAAQSEEPPGLLEKQTRYFSLVYPATEEDQAEQIMAILADGLDRSYEFMRAVFQTDLPVPITIRLYSTFQNFVDLNALLPPIADDAWHTRVGAREIAVLLDRREMAWSTTPAETVNVFRAEVAGMFASYLSADLAPPALVVGLGRYLRLPGGELEGEIPRLSAAVREKGLLAWSDLFDSATGALEDYSLAAAQSQSVVAYFAEAYGFPALVRLLTVFPAHTSYRGTLAQVYGASATELETGWKEYLPHYLAGRWRLNVLYNFDLSPVEAMLAGGAYSAANRYLADLTPFLESTGQRGTLEQVAVLKEKARVGMAADELVRAERNALQAGEYDDVLKFADHARDAFASLNDSSRLDEIDAYATWAQEVLSLRLTLEGLADDARLGRTSAEEMLLQAGGRLQELGDKSGVEQTRQALASLEKAKASRTRNLAFLAAGLLAVILLRRSIPVFLRPQRVRQPEADLL